MRLCSQALSYFSQASSGLLGCCCPVQPSFLPTHLSTLARCSPPAQTLTLRALLACARCLPPGAAAGGGGLRMSLGCLSAPWGRHVWCLGWI